MRFIVEGTKYEFDSDKLMYSELVAIQRYTGQTYNEWTAALRRFDTFSVGALVWVTKKHAGEDPGPLETFEFGIGTWEALDDEETPATAADPTPEAATSPELVEDSTATTPSAAATT